MSTPYFYIVRHKQTGKRYAGVSFGKTSDPSTFMTANGYSTSSDDVLALIKKEGLDSFAIDEILLNECINVPFGLDVCEYESWFLQTNDCASDDGWFNKHNNESANFASDAYKSKVKQTMLIKYGVDNPMLIPEVKEKFAEMMRGNRYGAKPRSEETKARMSAAFTGRVYSKEHNNKIRQSKIGKKASEETKKKMSDARQRGMHPRAKKVQTPLGAFDCTNDAADAHGVTSGAVRKWVKAYPADFFFL